MSLCTIVGMGSGIGFSVAKRFAKEGFDIAMIARGSEHLQRYARFLEDEYGTKTGTFAADAGEFDLLRAAFTQIEEKCGGTDVLVYHAAVLRKTKPLLLSSENLMNHFRVNVGGAITAVQQVLPKMIQQEKGTILFTGGGFAHDPNPDYFALGLGKAALLNYGLSLAKEYGPKGIHVAVVSIYGKVAPGTRYDPDLISEKYWELHTQPREKWKREVHVR